MKKSLTMLAAVAAMALGGCGETANRSQYQFGGAPVGENAAVNFTTEDRESLRQLIASVADRFKLQDMTAGSLVPGVFAHFRQIDASYPVQIVGYNAGQRPIVEVIQTHPYGGETDLYRHVKEALVEEIDRQFKGRVEVTPELKFLREKRPRPEPTNAPAAQP